MRESWKHSFFVYFQTIKKIFIEKRFDNQYDNKKCTHVIKGNILLFFRKKGGEKLSYLNKKKTIRKGEKFNEKQQ